MMNNAVNATEKDLDAYAPVDLEPASSRETLWEWRDAYTQGRPPKAVPPVAEECDLVYEPGLQGDGVDEPRS